MTTRKRLTALLVSNSLLMLTTAYANAADQQPAAASTTELLQTSLSIGTADSGTTDLSAASVAVVKAAKAPQVPMNAAAAKFVEDYIKKNNEVLQKVEARSEGVFKIIEPILAKYEIPAELKYLAVVESDLKRTAVSRVGAAGPWQLMPTTARELGLKVSRKADERKQYYKSTTAAAKYLRDLYNAYGDWLLVIAAYNAGPGTINKAIQRSGSRNFWKLQYFLPAETRGHVKRFIGTHYFFEDGGSEATLTKAENLAHAKALAQYASLAQNETETKPVAALAVEMTALKDVTAESVVPDKRK